MPTPPTDHDVLPALTACSLCTGETLGPDDPAPGQLGRLRSIADDGVARLTLSECLDLCERGDVVVARPAPSVRAARPADRAVRPVWFERLAGDELTGALRGWLGDGGPGRSPVPPELRGNVVDRRPPAA